MTVLTGPFIRLHAQAENSSQPVERALVYRSDTLPVMLIPELRIYDANRFNYLKARKYRRLVYNVKKTYPYAVVANARLKALDREMAQMKSKKEQKEFMDAAEKEVMKEFRDEIERLSITQGILLVKLIDRETGRTSYEVIKDIKGGVTAFFWQGIAKLFNNDLKLHYDPEGEDRVVEDILTAMEYGFI